MMIKWYGTHNKNTCPFFMSDATFSCIVYIGTYDSKRNNNIKAQQIYDVCTSTYYCHHSKKKTGVMW